MEFIGTRPTEEEKNRILCPYATNTGENWTEELLAEYVEHGVDIIAKDNELSNNINNGLDMLKNKQV